MPTTPKLGLPYPASSDAPNGQAQFQNLATAIDSLERLQDTGWVTTGFTAATGWAIRALGGGNASGFRRYGPVVTLSMRLERTGASVAVNADGNVSPDLALVSGIPTAARPRDTGYFKLSAPVGVGDGTFRVHGTGAIDITDAAPGVGALDFGTFVQIDATWMVA